MVRHSIERAEKELSLRHSNDVVETVGNLQRTAELGFDGEQDLLRHLLNKVCLDLGSGGGGFAVEVYAQLTETIIVSLNPRLLFDHYCQQHLEDRVMLERKLAEQPNTDFTAAVKRYDQLKVAGKWESLPFAPNAFDYIFATGSFLFYQHTYHPTVLVQILSKLKPTGEFRAEVYSVEDPEVEEAVRFARSCGYHAIIGQQPSTFYGFEFSNYIIFRK